MFRTVGRIVNWAGKYKKRLYLGCVCSFFATWFSALPVVIASVSLSQVLDDQAGRAELEWEAVLFSFLGIVASIFFRFLFSYWRARLQDSIGNEVAAEDRLEIGDILRRVSLGYFSKNTTGNLLTAITGDLSSLELQGLKLVDSVLNGYINLFAVMLMMFVIHPAGGLIVMGGAISSFIFLNRIHRHGRKNAVVKLKSMENITDSALAYVHGLPVVKAFHQEGSSAREWREACTRHQDVNLEIEHGFVPNNCAYMLSLKLSSVLLILFAGLSVVNGNMELPLFLLIAMFAFMIFGAVEHMSDSVYMLALIEISMDKLDRIKKAEFIDEDGVDTVLSGHDIAFCDVSFGYGENRVLHHVSFEIPEHTSTAIVGASGSGKTTICNLMTRFYDVDEGAVKVGGRDVRKMTCDSLLRNISMVFQHVYLFHDTVWNNIKFGKPDATDEEVWEAARKAKCHDFIQALPEGYRTMVGEGGATLSGGEKQRISIARAFLKDAPIVILDEATASVDPENEHLIQEAIESLVRGKTLITIAHRLKTIEHADRILVLKDGHLVQIGTHSELCEREGVYRDFIEIRRRAEGWYIA